MPIPDWIIPNDFLDNIGDDVVAVDPAGHIVGRAATREALAHAHTGESVTILSATDFADAPVEPETVADAAPAIAADDTGTDAPPKKSKKKAAPADA